MLYGWDEETTRERKSRFMVSWCGEIFRGVVGPRVAVTLIPAPCKYWWSEDGWIFYL